MEKGNLCFVWISCKYYCVIFLFVVIKNHVSIEEKHSGDDGVLGNTLEGDRFWIKYPSY